MKSFQTSTLSGLAALALLQTVAADGELDRSNMPQSLCGWPSLHTGGRFPDWNTRLAQYLLGYALNDPNIAVDGVFTSETTEQIELFQGQAGLPVNGYLNIDTWPSLMDTVTPLSPENTRHAVSTVDQSPVKALQDALTANGFPTTINGIFDNETVASLSAFQTARHADVTSGTVVDEQSWHLLTTMCNSTVDGGYYWIDIGWPQGNVSVDTFKCLHDERGFVYTTIECWRNTGDGTWFNDCVQNVENAWTAGYKYVDVYMFPQRHADPAVQATQLLGNLTAHNVRYGAVMLDIEGDDWASYSQESNRDFMLSLRSVFDDANVAMTMYSGSTWGSNFGDDFHAFSDLPLTYAHYDNIASFYDYYEPYGGWEVPAAKQFWDAVDGEIVCNLSVDWDWSPIPFWENR